MPAFEKAPHTITVKFPRMEGQYAFHFDNVKEAVNFFRKAQNSIAEVEYCTSYNVAQHLQFKLLEEYYASHLAESE